MLRAMSLANFHDKSHHSATSKMSEAVDQLLSTIPDEQQRTIVKSELKTFRHLFRRFLDMRQSKTVQLDWNKIAPPSKKHIVEFSELPRCPQDRIRSLLEKLVVLKLNGGLGTTMGCKGPKSVIEVREDSTFLDLTVRQIEYLNDTFDVDVPLVLMNSFNTDKETAEVIRKYTDHNVSVLMFNQKCHPRIFKDTLLPMPTSADPEKLDLGCWNPPGHGDVYDSFKNSPLWDDLRKSGKEYLFIANVDNLGATIDVDILNYLSLHSIDFCMEVTKKTRADVKGGTLIDYDGKVKLLEIAQCPKDKVEEFKSIKKFKVFNTNNIWVSLRGIEEHISDFLNLDLIVNQKTLPNGKVVIQLETACGAAIQHFESAVGLNVPRSRFLPVKSCSDLLLVQSNLYTVNHGILMMNPARIEKAGDDSVPIIKLGDKFAKVGEYMDRFAGIPNIIELDMLTVSGDVTFGSNITLKGTVIIVANVGDRIDIPSGSVLENQVITGNLRLLPL